MQKYRYAGLVLCGIAVVMAQIATFSIGDTGQYVGSITSTPTMTGNIVEFTAGPRADQGVDVFLSPDLRNSIKDLMESNCKVLNDQCFQSVRDGLVNPNTQLVSRQAQFLFPGALVVAYLSLLFPFFYHEHKQIPVTIKLDLDHVVEASSAATATEIVVVPTSGPPITITPKPKPPTVTDAAAAPAITTFMSAVDGHQKGDVVISLPPDLASRMDKIIRRSDRCAMNYPHGRKVQKRLDNFDAVICASEMIVMNAAPGGMFAELLVLQGHAFPWRAVDAVRAMNVVIGYARNQAPNLQLSQVRATAVGIAAFAAAWEVFINNKVLSSSIEIPASFLVPTATTTGCPIPRCDAGCELIGAIAHCSTSCVKPTRSCSATSSGTTKITTTATTPWVVRGYGVTNPTPTTSKPCIKVTINNCVYDYETLSAGQACPTIPSLPESCSKTTHAPPLPTPTLSHPVLQAQHCHGANEFGSHGDIEGKLQFSGAKAFCADFNQSFSSETAALKWNSKLILYYSGIIDISPYHWTVRWIDGCATTLTEQSVSNPLGPGNPSVNCVSLMTENWQNCNNGGAGGTRDAGCLRYNFAATSDQDQIS